MSNFAIQLVLRNHLRSAQHLQRPVLPLLRKIQVRQLGATHNTPMTGNIRTHCRSNNIPIDLLALCALWYFLSIALQERPNNRTILVRAWCPAPHSMKSRCLSNVGDSQPYKKEYVDHLIVKHCSRRKNTRLSRVLFAMMVTRAVKMIPFITTYL